MTIWMCVGLYNGNPHSVEHLDCKKRNKTFRVELSDHAVF